MSTGNAGLDTMLDGGLVGRRPYLLVGPSGTGKTTLALHFLCAGVQRGERALLVTLEEPPNEIRANHPGLMPELSRVDVFDAIPDVMRYERAPFKDIAAVRAATPFDRIPERIRQTPELTSIEVTITALEQMLRTEVQRHAYTRIAIDSLTALQYFCMKGFDIVAGAQTFLRFLSDLRVTTLLTVEAPLEDVETPERMLARGEIRLFRWELDDVTVRALGVEKFRGSAHDTRLHPYRIGPKGIDINLAVTISRDTRQVIESPTPLEPGVPTSPRREVIPSSLDLLADELRDLSLVGADVDPIRTELDAALAAARAGDLEFASERLGRALALGAAIPEHMGASAEAPKEEVAHALRRLATRAEAGRAGYPPVRLPEPPILTARLTKLLADLPRPAAGAPETPLAETPAPSPSTVAAREEVAAPPVSEPAAASLPTPVEVADRVPDAPPAAAPAHPSPPAPPVRPARSSPPPLPQAVRLPDSGPPVSDVPIVAVTSRTKGTPRARAASATIKAARGEVPMPPAAATPVEPHELEAPPAAAPKKRKRAATSARKKAASTAPAGATESPPVPTGPASPAVPSHAPLPSPVATTPVTPGPSGPAASIPPAAAPTVAPPEATVPAAPAPLATTSESAVTVPAAEVTVAVPKPKRRVTRKKKAPPVVGATPGPPPDDTAAPIDAAAASEPVPTERPPEAP